MLPSRLAHAFLRKYVQYNMMGDLSDYEKVRLENIQRNNAFLEQLGLSLITKAAGVDDESPDAQLLKKRKTIDRHQKETRKAIPTRSSPRLQKINHLEDLKSNDFDNEQHSETSNALDYDSMPFDSNELDDFEFQVFVELKAWRLAKSKELDLEPYKVAQNRTLAEFVRRKRNRADWGGLHLPDSDLTKDLLDCWGIGPAKAKPGGFGWELNSFMSSRSDLMSELCKSRDLGANNNPVMIHNP